MLVCLQALSGALVVETRISVVSTLIHAFFVSLLFVVEAYMWLHTIERPVGVHIRPVVGPTPVARRAQRSAGV